MARNEAIPDCAGEYARRECRSQPLIAAEATTFVLTQKVAKSQDKKILPPTGKTPRPALFVGPLPAFDYGSIKIVWINNVSLFSSRH